MLDTAPTRTYFAPAFAGGSARMSASEPPREPRGTPSGEPGDLARLGERIDRLRGTQPDAEAEAGAAAGRALGYGWRISIEMVVAVLFCGVIGWLVDLWLGSRPWGMIALIVLGFAVGIRNAIRLANEMEAAYLREQAQKRGETSGRPPGDRKS